MSRIRTIKPEWLDDEEIVLLGSDARTLSIALIILADDYGNGRANRLLLRSRVFPVSDQSVLDLALSELERARFVELYELDGQSYFHIRSWNKHQRVDKPGKPRVPQPPEVSRKTRERSRRAPDSLAKVPGTLAPDLYHDHDHDHDHDQEDRSRGPGAEAPPLGSAPEPPAAEAASSLEPEVTEVTTKPRRSDEAKAALRQALKASFRASGDVAPEVSDGVATKAARRVREFVDGGFAADLAEASARLVDAARKSGGKWPWCLLDASPRKPSGPPLARSARVHQAPGTTAADFEDAEDVETQIARWANG